MAEMLKTDAEYGCVHSGPADRHRGTARVPAALARASGAATRSASHRRRTAVPNGRLSRRLLGALIDDGALVARKRHAVLVVLEEVLAHLRPDLFEQEAQMGGDGVVAQNGMARLKKSRAARARRRTRKSQLQPPGAVPGPDGATPATQRAQGPRERHAHEQVAHLERQQQQPRVSPRILDDRLGDRAIHRGSVVSVLRQW